MKLKFLLKSIMLAALVAVSVTLSGSAYRNTQDFSENYNAIDSVEREKSEVVTPQTTENTEIPKEDTEY